MLHDQSLLMMFVISLASQRDYVRTADLRDTIVFDESDVDVDHHRMIKY